MSTELEKFLSTLKGCLDTQHSARAKDCVASIGTLVAGPEALNAAEIEYSLDTILNSPNGLLAFLRRAIKASGRFQKANEQIFDLFRRLIQQHATPVRKSSAGMLRECIRYVHSSSVSARERELATAVVQDLVVYRCLDDDVHGMTQLLTDLLAVFDQRKLTNRFQQALFELVGLLARDFPECVSQEHQAKILTTMMSVAEGQLLEESYPSLISLAGALQGLNHFLVNFAPPGSGNEEDEASGSDVYRRIYVLVKKLSDWDEAVKERQAFRSEYFNV
ncbi:uncharacterized protein LOC128093398 [Culex pipiens pallens]|uniref:uncharacterized protein LOC128093398 n=1 Tax=Culex pipiens pallens TaxID=42434 RepID=UPI0022AAB42D|nr:uncharacterized protein LOC128093398 [Culex pipiens pallens]